MTNEKTTNTKIGLACFFCEKSIETAKEVVRSDFYMNACDECYEKEHNRNYADENDHPNFDDSALECSSESQEATIVKRYPCDFCDAPATRAAHCNRYCDECYENTFGE